MPEDYIYDEVRSDEFEQITSGTRGCANPFSSKLVETVNIQNNLPFPGIGRQKDNELMTFS